MKVLVLANHVLTLSLFRPELIASLADEGYAVTLAMPISPNADDVPVFSRCELVNIPVDRRGSNPVSDLILFLRYVNLLRRIKPDVVLTYTVKPNLYGGLACRICKIPYMPNVTGLGSGMASSGLITRIIRCLSGFVYPKAYTLFVQNEENLRILKEIHGDLSNICMLPGSGVNLEKFAPQEYPDESVPVTFQLVARIMKEKGIDEYLQAAKSLRQKYPDVIFRVVGMIDEEKYDVILNDFMKHGIIDYLGFQKDIRPFIKSCHCTVNPSYHEGMSNVLLESAASARPVIASDIHGCREIVDDTITGFLCIPHDAEDLAEKLELFICLPYEDKVKMGLAGRRKVELDFDRRIVVDRYIQTIREVLGT